MFTQWIFIGVTPTLTFLIINNEAVTDQPTLLEINKNKNVRDKKTIDDPIPQTKHPTKQKEQKWKWRRHVRTGNYTYIETLP